MSVEKMSVSFDLTLGGAIRESAARRALSVSAWLAEAARAQLRNEMLSQAVDAWQERFGALTDDEIAAAEELLDRAARTRDGKGAR